MADEEKDKFVHSSADARFRARNSAIFGGLSALEVKHEKEVPTEDPFSESGKGKKYPRRPQKVPEHVLHPGNWTKYSLEEDGTQNQEGDKKGDDLNRDVALKFLADLRRRKEGGNGSEERMDSSAADSAVNFVSLKRKREQVEKDEEVSQQREEKVKDCTENSSTTSSRVLKMQTYEFGQKVAKASTSHSHSTLAEKELTLYHLDESQENSSSNLSGLVEEPQIDEASKHEELKSKLSFSKRGKKNFRKNLPADDGDD